MISVRDQEFLNGLSKRLRSLREDQNLSQEDLAYKSGLALSQIGRIERAEINPTICTLKVLADTFGLDLSEVFDFDA